MQPQKQPPAARHDDQGGARANFLIVAAIIAAVAYVGYQYIPAAYQSYQFGDVMQNDVDRAAALGQSVEVVRKQLVAQGPDYGVPPNAVITAVQKDGHMEARVQYIRPISLPGYTYEYSFDRTVQSSSMLSGK